MPWIKLTSQALYWMEGDNFLKKVDLKKRPNPAERSINLPIDWFVGSNLPSAAVVSLKTTTEPSPAPQPPLPPFHLNRIPDPWKPAATPLVPVLVKAFQDQGLMAASVLAYASATIGRESSWNPKAVNQTDAAAQTGYPGAGLAQITWKDNYKAVTEATGIDFLNHPGLMFNPYNSLRAKAAFYQINNMISYIQAGDYESAAGMYNAGRATFRSSYTRNVAADTVAWLPVFS